MKQSKKRWLCLITAVMITLISLQPLMASTVVKDGSSEVDAIELRLGKSKTASFQIGTGALFFMVELPQSGQLDVDVTCKSLGKDIVVEMYCQNNAFFKQAKAFYYDKSKKTTKGHLTAEYVTPTDRYFVKVTHSGELKTKKPVKITVKQKNTGYADLEPNNDDKLAQSIVVNAKKSKKTYKMLLSRVEKYDLIDKTDCLTFRMTKAQKVNLSLSTKDSLNNVTLQILKKTDSGPTVIKEYPLKGKSYNKTIKLSKGTYWLQMISADEGEYQVTYNLSVYK